MYIYSGHGLKQANTDMTGQSQMRAHTLTLVTAWAQRHSLKLLYLATVCSLKPTNAGHSLKQATCQRSDVSKVYPGATASTDLNSCCITASHKADHCYQQ